MFPEIDDEEIRISSWMVGSYPGHLNLEGSEIVWELKWCLPQIYYVGFIWSGRKSPCQKVIISPQKYNSQWFLGRERLLLCSLVKKVSNFWIANLLLGLEGFKFVLHEADHCLISLKKTPIKPSFVVLKFIIMLLFLDDQSIGNYWPQKLHMKSESCYIDYMCSHCIIKLWNLLFLQSVALYVHKKNVVVSSADSDLVIAVPASDI